MAKYKFPVEAVRIYEGYTIIVVEDHIAEIDESDEHAVSLAQRHGGVKAAEKKTRAKRGRK